MDDRLSDKDKKDLFAELDSILKKKAQKPSAKKDEVKLSKKEELMAVSVALVELEKVRHAFLKFQDEVKNNMVIGHLAPALIEMADYCIDFEKLIKGELIEDDDDKDIVDTLIVGREYVLKTIIRFLKEEGKI